MTQGLETMHVISSALYQYYLSYQGLSIPIDQDVYNGFYNALINGFKMKCDYYDLSIPTNVLDSFILLDKPFDQLLQFDTIENGYSKIVEELIRFPQEHRSYIHNGYQLISILPFPFDSFDITHGMVMNYFTPRLNQSI